MENTDRSAIKAQIKREAERHFETALTLSHRIHENPEVGFEEHRAHDWMVRAVSELDMELQDRVDELDTAFVAQAGEGPLSVGICAEYDALPNVGHACGHNVIAAAAYLSTAALRPFLETLGVSVRILGTPAEESGGGKVLMLEKGSFKGLNAAMIVHPAPTESDRMPTLAAKHLDITYRGREAHASGYPQEGINALDAMTIAQVAIGLQRQHIYPYDQVHGYVKHGGDAPNVIPALVEAMYLVRSRTLSDLTILEPKIRRCFEAGALATGSQLEITNPSPPYSEFVTDEEMASLYRDQAQLCGRPFPDPTREFRASTDMANISLEIPSIHPLLDIDSLPAINHQPEFTRAAGSSAADRAIFEGALAMAYTVVEIASTESLRSRLISHRCR